jgi:hypothetical protein
MAFSPSRARVVRFRRGDRARRAPAGRAGTEKRENGEQDERASESVGWTFGDTATVAALADALLQRDRSFLAGWALGAVGAAYRAAIWLRRPGRE